MYPGAELPDDSVAIVTGSRTVEGVRIFFRGRDEDGKEITVYKIEVPAGRQQITVHFTAPSGAIYRAGRTILFNAEGGHTYRVEGVEWDDRVYIWVEDTYTHEIVGGKKP
jgi:hypothetical protein